MDKNYLRRDYTIIRAKILDKKERSDKIALKVIKDPDFIKAKTVAIYKNGKNEVDTSQIIINATMNGKTVVIPRVEGDDLQFYKYSIHTKLIESEFGILEPEPIEENKVSKQKIDLCIVPGIAFDMANNRIGFGKGYYDRFLAGTKMKKIGICFEEQILKDGLLPSDERDVKMDKVIY